MEADTVVLMITIVGSVLGSSLTTIYLLLRQMNHLDTKFTGQIAALDTKFTGQIAALDTKFTGQIAALDTKFTGQIAALDTKFTGQIAALDTKFTGQIAALDTKFTGKFDTMGRDISDIRERLARVEGHLMAPEGFALRSPRPPATGEPPPEDPAPDHRRAS